MALQTVSVRTGENPERFGARYRAVARPPWNTHASGAIIGYSEDSEFMAINQLQLMLIDLGNLLGVRFECFKEEG